MNVDASRSLIESALAFGKATVAFSGGKDSSLVLHLVREIDPSIQAVFTDTGIESTSTLEVVRQTPNCETIHPNMNYWQIIRKHGWPGQKDKARSHGNACCRILKETPAHHWYHYNAIDVVFTGLTMAESHQRAIGTDYRGPFYYAKTWGCYMCHPIWDWRANEVLDYLRANNIAYNSSYDRGALRVGCTACTAYKGWHERMLHDDPQMYLRVLRVMKHQEMRGGEPCGGW